jgi:hypothetical protein
VVATQCYQLHFWWPPFKLCAVHALTVTHYCKLCLLWPARHLRPQEECAAQHANAGELDTPTQQIECVTQLSKIPCSCI